MAAMVKPSFAYCGSTKWTAVTAWISNNAYSVGAIITNTNNSPAVGSERCFVCVVAGTSTNGTLPTLTTTFGAKTADNTVIWQECTGQPGVNGDTTNTQTWAGAAKSNTVALGQMIYDSGTTSLQICTTAGTAGSGAAPSFSGTAGVTTSDNTVTWTSLGAPPASWAAPHARVSNATNTNWLLNGATCYVSNNNAETSATTTTFTSGAAATPEKIISVDDTSGTPPTAVLSGGSIATTALNTIRISNYQYFTGLTFSSGSGANNNAALITGSGAGALYYENCTLKCGSTNSTGCGIQLGNGAANIYNNFQGCTFVFGATGQTIIPTAGFYEFINCTFAATGSVPTTLINNGSGANGFTTIIIRDSDLSAITGTLLALNSATLQTFIYLENCKLGSGVTMTSGSNTNQGGVIFKMHNCDSGSKNYRFYESSYYGTVQQETTIIETSGGYTDGTTPLSWNMTSSANTTFTQPLVCSEFWSWNDTTGSHTITVQLASNSSLTNGDFWIEAEYPGSSSFSIGSVTNSRKANILSSNTTLSAGNAWNGSPTNTYSCAVSITVNMKGPIKVRCFLAKASTTVYVNAVPNIT